MQLIIYIGVILGSINVTEGYNTTNVTELSLLATESYTFKGDLSFADESTTTIIVTDTSNASELTTNLDETTFSSDTIKTIIEFINTTLSTICPTTETNTTTPMPVVINSTERLDDTYKNVTTELESDTSTPKTLPKSSTLTAPPDSTTNEMTTQTIVDNTSDIFKINNSLTTIISDTKTTVNPLIKSTTSSEMIKSTDIINDTNLLNTYTSNYSMVDVNIETTNATDLNELKNETEISNASAIHNTELLTLPIEKTTISPDFKYISTIATTKTYDTFVNHTTENNSSFTNVMDNLNSTNAIEEITTPFILSDEKNRSEQFFATNNFTELLTFSGTESTQIFTNEGITSNSIFSESYFSNSTTSSSIRSFDNNLSFHEKLLNFLSKQRSLVTLFLTLFVLVVFLIVFYIIKRILTKKRKREIELALEIDSSNMIEMLNK